MSPWKIESLPPESLVKWMSCGMPASALSKCTTTAVLALSEICFWAKAMPLAVTSALVPPAAGGGGGGLGAGGGFSAGGGLGADDFVLFSAAPPATAATSIAPCMFGWTSQWKK